MPFKADPAKHVSHLAFDCNLTKKTTVGTRPRRLAALAVSLLLRLLSFLVCSLWSRNSWVHWLPTFFHNSKPGSIPGRLTSWSLSSEFQPETPRAMVSIGFRDHVLLAADRTLAEQALSNIFVRTAFPVVEHLGNVLREPDRHHLLFMRPHYRGTGRS
jgi:hypothetical protein